MNTTAINSSTTANGAAAKDARLKAQCQAFEGLLLGEMLKSMRKTVPHSKGLMGESSSEQQTRQMYDEKLCDVLSARGVLGIGQQLYNTVKQKAAKAAGPAAVATAADAG